MDYVLDSESSTLIKIDVEGWDLEVLKGARHTPSKKRPVARVIEVNEDPSLYGISPPDTFDFMGEYGSLPNTHTPESRRFSRGIDLAARNVIFIRDVDQVRRRPALRDDGRR